MKLSKTLMINAELLPSNKKAFTLAEVLITLSILGVVAALTIPSLVNRNSDIAAQTKLKKAIATYETVAGTYMAESGKADTKLFMHDAPVAVHSDNACTNAANYFKIVSSKTSKNCQFITSDGAFWVFNSASGYAVVYDADTSPRYGVLLWTHDGNVNVQGVTIAAADAPSAPSADFIPVHKYYTGPDFLKASSTNLSKGTGSSETINAALNVVEDEVDDDDDDVDEH